MTSATLIFIRILCKYNKSSTILFKNLSFNTFLSPYKELTYFGKISLCFAVDCSKNNNWRIKEKSTSFHQNTWSLEFFMIWETLSVLIVTFFVTIVTIENLYMNLCMTALLCQLKYNCVVNWNLNASQQSKLKSLQRRAKCNVMLCYVTMNNITTFFDAKEFEWVQLIL